MINKKLNINDKIDLFFDPKDRSLSDESKSIVLELSNKLRLKDELNSDTLRSYLEYELNSFGQQQLGNQGATISLKALSDKANDVLENILYESITIMDKNEIVVRYINDDIVKNHYIHLSSFKFFEDALVKVYSLYTKITRNEAIKKVDRLISLLKIKESDDSVIAFSNCYFENGKFYSTENIDKILPKFIIQHNYNENNTFHLKSFNKLMDFLSNNDKNLKQILINQMSLTLLRTTDYRRKYGRLVRFYGATGGNGKSTFLNFLSKVFDDKYSKSYSFDQLGLDATLLNLKHSLLAIDYDSPSKYSDDQSTTSFKKIVVADTLSARPLYHQEVQSFTILSTMWLASNAPFKSYDKTDSITRRLIPIRLKEKLPFTQKDHDDLLSDKSIESVRNLIIKTAIDISKNRKLLDVESKSLQLELLEIAKENNNVLSFIEDTSIENIEDFSVKYVRNLYENWCEKNAELPLKRGTFNATIESQLNLKRTPRFYSKTKDFLNNSNLEKDTTNPNSKIKTWIKN